MLFSSIKSDVKSTARQCSILYLVSYLLLIACSLAVLPTFAGKLEKNPVQDTKFEAQDLYQALIAELYNNLGEDNLAVDSYYELSISNKDPAIAKRVTELATATGQIAKALDAAKRWVELMPNDLEANQYLSLLLLRNSYFKYSAKQIDVIRDIIDKSSDQSSVSLANLEANPDKFHSSESLRFIGALLAAEAHHEKAYSVFELYLKNYASKLKDNKFYQKQQRLISAQLAMKAKKYAVVVSSLKGLKNLDAENHVDSVVLHAKALHKLGKNNESIKYLESIQKHSEANDSHRLELVRLLVLSKQKNKALPILKSLVSKYPKNLELLKSYVALRIDQSKLKNIQLEINKLAADVKYKNEAHYFSGEYAEKLGQREKALLSYADVSEGSYLKNAHKKRIYLTKLIHGQLELSEFFAREQKNATSLAKQAYWIKLQADDLFEYFHYSKALSLYDKAVKLMPKKTRYRYKRGLVNERLGNFEKAETDFKFVLDKRDNDTDTLNALGYMLTAHTDRFVEAKKLIDKAFKLKPNDPLILDSLGFVFYKTGNLIKAEKYLRRAFSLMKKPEVASHLITVLAKSNQIKEANQIYIEMQKIFPNSQSLEGVSHFLP